MLIILLPDTARVVNLFAGVVLVLDIVFFLALLRMVLLITL